MEDKTHELISLYENAINIAIRIKEFTTAVELIDNSFAVLDKIGLGIVPLAAGPLTRASVDGIRADIVLECERIPSIVLLPAKRQVMMTYNIFIEIVANSRCKRNVRRHPNALMDNRDIYKEESQIMGHLLEKH